LAIRIANALEFDTNAAVEKSLLMNAKGNSRINLMAHHLSI